MHTHETNVVVTGAGPVGLATALFLHDCGQDVVVVEEKPAGVTHSYALALHPASLRLFASIGVADRLLREARRVEQLAVYAGGERLLTLPVAGGGERFPGLAILGQDVIESVLGDELRRRKVPVWWNHRLAGFVSDGENLRVQLDELEERTTGYASARFDRLVGRVHFLAARHLVGADGHGSLVRRRLGIEFPEVAPAEHYAVFEFQTDQALPDEIALVLDEAGMGVLWPLPGGRARWSFAVDPEKFPVAVREKDHEPVQIVTPGVFPALTESALAALLQERAPWFRATVRHIYWRMMVRFERRMVAEFGRGGSWLAGDAAHLTAPAGIQSMNVGIAEARVLAAALSAGTPARRDELLRNYNDAAVAHWRHLQGLAGEIAVSDTALPIVRQLHRALPACLPASGVALEKMAAGLGLKIDMGQFNVDALIGSEPTA